MFTEILIAAILTGLAAAAPAPTLAPRADSGSFTLITIDSASPIQYATINANGLNFWIGKPPSSYCPADASITCPRISSTPYEPKTMLTETPAGNVTALSVYTSAGGGASTDTEVPGGQYVYAAADGALSYTVPHSGVIPADATSGPFVYNAASGDAQVGSFQLDGKDFFACPTSDSDVYQIYADVPGFTGVGCLFIAIATEPYEGVAAWQY